MWRFRCLILLWLIAVPALAQDVPLTDFYAQKNQEYFANRLPPMRLEYSQLPCLGHNDSEWYPKSNRILICSDFKNHPDVSKMLIFHEMIHIKLYTQGNKNHDHDLIFNLEMRHLAKEGAFDEYW